MCFIELRAISSAGLFSCPHCKNIAQYELVPSPPLLWASLNPQAILVYEPCGAAPVAGQQQGKAKSRGSRGSKEQPDSDGIEESSGSEGGDRQRGHRRDNPPPAGSRKGVSRHGKLEVHAIF